MASSPRPTELLLLARRPFRGPTAEASEAVAVEREPLLLWLAGGTIGDNTRPVGSERGECSVMAVTVLLVVAECGDAASVVVVLLLAVSVVVVGAEELL